VRERERERVRERTIQKPFGGKEREREKERENARKRERKKGKKEREYGEVQCYLSKRCSARIIAGDKHSSKNILDANLTVYYVSKYLCADMAICNIQKYFVLI